MNWTLIWAAVTAVGTVFAGLALPLAFVQLRALRQDRLRAQVSKVGAWAVTPKEVDLEAGWRLTVFIRNGSELPVQVDVLDWTIRADEGPQIHTGPGTIGPADTWSMEYDYRPKAPPPRRGNIPRPVVSIDRIVITDTAGHQWEMRSSAAGPWRRVQRRRRWSRKRHR